MTEDRLITLIVKYLSGNSSEEERAIIMEWIQGDPARRLMLDRFSNEETLNSELERWGSIQPSLGYGNWLNALKARRRSRVLRISSRVAAACLILAVGAWWLFRKQDERPTGSGTPYVAVVHQPATPGRNTATLTLSNGRQILLDSARNGELAIQGNARLVKTDSSTVSYTVTTGTAGKEIGYNTLTTPRAGQYQLLLPDGSHVWLNNASDIRYPVSFAGNTRTVEVTGEAYFEVAKDVNRPFIVKLKDQTIEVLGTSFNTKAFGNEPTTETTLLQGSVKVKNGKDSVDLLPDQQAQTTTNGNLRLVKDVSAENIISWKSGFFNFGRVSFKEVMRQLERWYDVDVTYEGAVPNLELVGKIDRSLSLKDVLQYLDKNQVHFRLDGRKLHVLSK